MVKIYLLTAHTTVPLMIAVTGIAIIVKGRGRREEDKADNGD